MEGHGQGRYGGSSFDGSVQFNYTFGGLVNQMEM